MSSDTGPSGAKENTPSRIAPWLYLIGAVLGVAAVAHSPLPAADTWWHVAAGDYLWQTRSFPSTDPFSFTADGHPWTNHEWLVELLYSSLYAVGELTALYGFRTLAIVLAFVLLPALASYRGGGQVHWWILFPILAWAGELAYYCDVRAYLVTYVLLSLTVFALLEFQKSGRTGWLVLCATVQIFWVNSHGAFILGPAVMGVFGLLGPRRKPILLACAATLLVACLNPYGVSMLLFPFSLLQTDAFSVGLNEWAPPDLLQAQLPYTLTVCVAALLTVWKRRSISLPLFFSSLAFVLLGLKAWRHEPLAALLLCYYLPALLREVRPPRKVLLPGGLATLLLGLAMLAPRLNLTVWELSMMEKFPVDAVRALKQNPQLPRHLWNPYGWGGYLLWQAGPDYQVFYDGRAHTVYPEAVYRDGNLIQYGEPWARVLQSRGLQPPAAGRLELLASYSVQIALCNKEGGGLAEVLSAPGSGWFLLYEDFVSTIHLPDTPENRTLASTFQRPRDEWAIMGEASAARGTETELERLRELVERKPRNGLYRTTLALALLERQHLEEAVEQLEQLRRHSPHYLLLPYLQARVWLAEGRVEDARKLLEEDLRRHPELVQTKQLLDSLKGPPSGVGEQQQQ
ncbi:MAG: tetratricopeptide repeat protein [Vulcanimicrobiota bacterium]